MNSKKCTKCGEVKMLEDFYRHNGIPDGHRPDCKVCVRKRSKEWAARNPDLARSNNAKWKKMNPDKVRLTQKKWMSSNRIQHAKATAEWRKRNPDKQRAAVRRWVERNPLEPAQKQQRRRTRKQENGVFLISKKDLQRVYGSSCAVCGSNEKITADHIIPISRGGRHSIGNIQPLCHSCNSSKCDKLMVEWRVRRSA